MLKSQSDELRNSIQELKTSIVNLQTEMNDTSSLQTFSDCSGAGSDTNTQSSNMALPKNVPSLPHKVASTEPTLARKFNVALFGLAECPKGTKKIEHDHSDLNNATTILIEVYSSVQSSFIRDTVRLEKFNPEGCPRPVLITLSRSLDVASILSKKGSSKITLC